MRALDEPLVFVDIETNGMSPVKGRVIEVAAIRVEHGEITKTLNTLIDPGTELPRFITSLTGIARDDLRGAPVFLQIAEELHAILDGAIFVAHNVRFDYSFLKQEFSRVGKPFTPRQLCTVRLSRALYPEHKSHKLAALIERHNFSYTDRHRAYDDAHILWQFIQHVHTTFDSEVIDTAVAKQLKQPSLPKHIDAELIKGLPETNGVYIFDDAQGQPLYVGKSVNVKQRVLSHFNRDHEITSEFKIAQHTCNIRTIQTASELEALLLESRLVKELQPLHNKQLRKVEKLLLAKRQADENGYHHVALEEAEAITMESIPDIMAVYPRRGAAKQSLETIVKTFELCPKLLGLEKASGACFWHQLHKCAGACIGKEPASAYNERLATAFEHNRIQAWPYPSPIVIRDRAAASGIIVDRWCVIAEFSQDEDCDPIITTGQRLFDLDTYKIIRTYIAQKSKQLLIQPISHDELAQFC